MPNSIDFYKGIFLHVIPVRIIVPLFNKSKVDNFSFIKVKTSYYNDLPTRYIANFEILRETVTNFLGIYIDKILTCFQLSLKKYGNYVQIQKYS